MNLKEQMALDWIHSRIHSIKDDVIECKNSQCLENLHNLKTYVTNLKNKNVKTIEEAFSELEMYRKLGSVEELEHFQKRNNSYITQAVFRISYFSDKSNICAVITNNIQYFQLDYTAVDFPKTKGSITEIVKEIIEDVAMLIDKNGISELEHAGWLEISQKDYFDLISNPNIRIFSETFNINKYWLTPVLNGVCCQNGNEITKKMAEELIINQFDINCDELEITGKLKNDEQYYKKFNIIRENYCNRYLEFFRKNKFFNCGDFSISYGAFPNINNEKLYTFKDII